MKAITKTGSVTAKEFTGKLCRKVTYLLLLPDTPRTFPQCAMLD